MEEVGYGVTAPAKGDEVYAMLDYGYDGAEAEFTIALPSELAPKPHKLDHVQAAAVPLSALTAWQALFVHASLAVGQTILIHGATGGVGVFAVQLAHWAGARVIATASARNRDFLRELGADEIIDYTTTRFEDVIHGVDFVFNTVGEDTLQRSWQVFKPGGGPLSVVSPRPSFEETKAYDVRPVWFVVQPNREQLVQISALIDERKGRPIIDTVRPFPRHARPTSKGRRATREGRSSCVWWTRRIWELKLSLSTLRPPIRRRMTPAWTYLACP